jgi:hypothetical protein
MDIIKVDVPTFLRLLELAREDVKQDTDLHDIAEIVTRMSQDRPVTMADYSDIVAFMQKQGGQHVPEDHSPENPNASYNVGEYDREGDMAKDQLRVANDAARELYDILDANDNLPEWVQKKITLAADYIDTVRDYMKANAENYGKTEAVDELDRIKQLGGIR